ncbi:LicD family protein [Proteus mirabilis]|uniref:LicD family protein n=1 Tax=Proteus mirabilis TaxID=584 RepID=UPI0018A6ECE7|nr:LicD family protein [Proteus mirabilis]MBF8455348.1 LicD family protein [Proteus mirabilis]
MENDLLRKAQLKMLTALIELDSICSKHNINYWIDAGTLLGAVRHKGFIPWDDDIDVCMIRKDFNKFIKVCSYELNKIIFFLQTINTDPHYKTYNIPCKLRVNNTLIIEESELKLGYYNDKSHHGLFLDVFPYDKYSKTNIK